MNIPKKLQSITNVTAPESTQYAINGVRMSKPKPGVARLEATDACRLISVDWPDNNGENFEAVVLSDDFDFAMDAVPDFSDLHAKESETGRVELSSNRGSSTSLQCVDPVDLNFPNMQACIEAADKEDGGITIAMNPILLAELLASIEEMSDGYPRVQIEVFGPKKPVRITAFGSKDKKITAMMMPLDVGPANSAEWQYE